MSKKEEKKILKIKRQLEELGIDHSNLVYMPEVPMAGLGKEYVVEEMFGIKVAKLVNTPDE